jgi:hypothetical protein
MYQLTLGIKDAKSFDNAKLMWMSENPGRPLLPWMNLPYEQAKPVIDQARAFSKQAVEDMKIRSEIAKNKATAAMEYSHKQVFDAQARYDKVAADAAEEAAAAAKKAGAPTPDPKHPSGAGGAKVTGLERMTANRLILAGNDLYTGLDEIMKLPIGAGRGTLGDVAYSTQDTFTGSAKKWLANKMTKDESHMYATRLAGVGIAAATVASGGMAARISQVEAEQKAIGELSGQSRLVAIDKIHQAALKARRGLELANVKDPQQKEALDLVLSRLTEVEEKTGTILDRMKGGSARAKEPESPKPDMSKPNVTQEEYAKLKPGQKFWYGGVEITKE